MWVTLRIVLFWLLMKISDYAKSLGVSYKTAWRMWKRGEINATQLSTGTIIVSTQKWNAQGVAIYTRVSSSENKSNLDSQAERMKSYCIAKGYQIKHIVKEIGSGVNDNRKKLIQLLEKDDYSLIVCEHKDRLTRVGFNYLKVLLNKRSSKFSRGKKGWLNARFCSNNYLFLWETLFIEKT